MPPPSDLDGLSPAELKGLVVNQWEQIVELQRMVAALRDEIARLAGGPGRPNLKPSGMERGTEPPGILGAAVTAYRAALQEMTRQQRPLVWAETESKLAATLYKLGEHAA